MLDWLIVGGGVHGTHHALNLLGAHGVAREAMRIVDPFPQLLTRWTECTQNTGMRYLRSPLVHNLDLAPFALRHYARDVWRPGRVDRHFLGPYKRPSLELFAAHAAHLAETNRLEELHVRGAVTALGERAGGGMRVETTAGTLDARRVLLAIGMSDQPEWPEWAHSLQAAGAAVDHLFDPGFRRDALPEWTHCVVVGGGISAAQAAVALAERQPGSVTLLSRHAMRVRQFDAPPGWIGPRLLAAYHRERDLVARRAAIQEARHRGSMPPDVASAFRQAIVSGILKLHTGEVVGTGAQGGEIEIRTQRPGAEETLRADRVVLATGFAAERPGGAWLSDAIESMRLPCAPCGFPIVDGALRWAERLHVSGPLAELEIGPVSRNIIGARLATERLRHAA